MFQIGQPEIDAVAKVIKGRKVFRYRKRGKLGMCDRFERRFARLLGVKDACMSSSGTTALTAALVGLNIGPGDEVLVPAHTYMATAVSVLAVGAIPVIIDIDESITISPAAIERAIGPSTRAIIPVHMWGLVCNMDAIMRIARKRNLMVIEDCCQCSGGAYKGKMVGSIGHAGVFSFNAYKNMTCGEGGAVVSSDPDVMRRARCSIDCCRAYWNEKDPDFVPFTSSGSRASEFEGAIMNAQLDRLGTMIRSTRRQKRRVLTATAGTGLQPITANSLDYECGTAVGYLLPTAAQADRFAKISTGVVALKTGRHTYIEWEAILNRQGAAHPALNPYNLPANEKCRKTYSKDMCAPSLDILSRTVMVGMHPDRPAAELAGLIEKIKLGARLVLETSRAKASKSPVKTPRKQLAAV